MAACAAADVDPGMGEGYGDAPGDAGLNDDADMVEEGDTVVDSFDGGVVTDEAAVVFDAAVDAAVDAADDAAVDDDAESDGDTQACLNSQDVAVMGATDIWAVVTTCGLDCFIDGRPHACISGCLTASTPLTEGCVECFADLFDCSLINCRDLCVPPGGDPGNEECRPCIDSNCRGSFETCSGTEFLEDAE